MDPKSDMVREHLLMCGFMEGYQWQGDEDDYDVFHGRASDACKMQT
jgi:hypothetical protein